MVSWEARTIAAARATISLIAGSSAEQRTTKARGAIIGTIVPPSNGGRAVGASGTAPGP
jgi:hypothetical protein